MNNKHTVLTVIQSLSLDQNFSKWWESLEYKDQDWLIGRALVALEYDHQETLIAQEVAADKAMDAIFAPQHVSFSIKPANNWLTRDELQAKIENGENIMPYLDVNLV